MRVAGVQYPQLSTEPLRERDPPIPTATELQQFPRYSRSYPLGPAIALSEGIHSKNVRVRVLSGPVYL